MTDSLLHSPFLCVIAVPDRPQKHVFPNAHSMGFSGVRKSILLKSLLIHLLCELFDGMPDLCGVEGYFIFCLPYFALVEIFCPLFSCLIQVIF